jgi:hypothetical protein
MSLTGCSLAEQSTGVYVCYCTAAYTKPFALTKFCYASVSQYCSTMGSITVCTLQTAVSSVSTAVGFAIIATSVRFTVLQLVDCCSGQSQ